MLICDIRIAKHELPRFGHPSGKIHNLIFVMLDCRLDIVQGRIISRRFFRRLSQEKTKRIYFHLFLHF